MCTMTINIKNTSLAIIGFLILSCEGNNCLKSVGEETSFKVALDTFSKLEIAGIMEVELIPDTAFMLEVYGGENLIEGVDYEINDEQLTLYNYNNCIWAKSYEKPLLKVYFDKLTYLDIDGSCHLYNSDSLTGNLSARVRTRVSEVELLLNTNSFSFYNHTTCGGVFTFRGKTNKLSISGYYSAIYNAENLQAQYATVNNYSVVDYKVWAVNKLNAEIHNVGSIYYKGNPEVSIDSLISSGGVYHYDE